MKCRRCEKRKAVDLHYLCKECYVEDDGEPRSPGKEINHLKRELEKVSKIIRMVRNRR